MSLHNGFKIVVATPKDRDKVEVFLRKHFYKNEPMHISLGVTEGHRCTKRMVHLENLHDGLSLIAVTNDEDERIAGICINGVDTPEESAEFVFTTECEKFKKFRKCMIKVEKDANIFQNTNANKALYVHILSVDPDYGRKGIGKALVEQSISRIAQAKGFPLVTIMCTSYYTAKIAEALCMDCVYVMRYDEYLDQNGVPVFSPPKPHEAIKFFRLAVEL